MAENLMMAQQRPISLKGERMLSVRETAEIMGWCLDSVRRKLRSGEIPGVRLGRNWRIPESQLAAFIGVENIGIAVPEAPPVANATYSSTRDRKGGSVIKNADEEIEVVDALLRTEAGSEQVLELVRRALKNAEVSPKTARQTLNELSDLLRSL